MDRWQFAVFEGLVKEFEQCILDVCADEESGGVGELPRLEAALDAARDRVLKYGGNLA